MDVAGTPRAGLEAACRAGLDPPGGWTGVGDEGLVIGNMIQVDRLSRRFGSFKAVDGVSFAVGGGEIVGLLGPNGAGKTTTMRMLTTYLTPTSGRATLAGHDVLDEPLEVRRKLGYLPENVPLYAEMRVREFLRFRARLKDVPRSKLRRAIGEVVAPVPARGGREPDHRPALAGVPPAGRAGRGDGARPADPDPRRADLGPRPDPDPRGPGADPRAGRAAHDPAVDPHPAGGRGGLRPGDHHRPGPDRGGRPAGRPEARHRDRGRGPGPGRRDPRRDPDDPGGRAGRRGPPGRRPTPSFEVHARDGRDLREAIGQKLVSSGWPLRRLDLRRSSLEERFIQAVNRETLADARREAA